MKFLKFLEIQPTKTILNVEFDGKIKHFDGEIWHFLTVIFRQYISFGLLLNHFTFITFIGFGISFVAFISIDLIYNAMPDVCPTLEYWSLQNMSYQVLVYLNSKFKVDFQVQISIFENIHIFDIFLFLNRSTFPKISIFTYFLKYPHFWKSHIAENIRF